MSESVRRGVHIDDLSNIKSSLKNSYKKVREYSQDDVDSIGEQIDSEDQVRAFAWDLASAYEFLNAYSEIKGDLSKEVRAEYEELEELYEQANNDELLGMYKEGIENYVEQFRF